MIGLERPTNQISYVSPGGAPGAIVGGSYGATPSVNAVQIDNQRLQDAANSNENRDPAGEEESTTTSNSGQGSEFSLSQLIMDNPNMSPEELLREAAKYSDEYAEMYTTYLLEQQRHDADNAYTAQREDTAYQRLVQDLKAAGLNPAMMYGSTASTHATGASGYSAISEGAHSRDVKNYQLLETLLLAIKEFGFDKLYKTTNTIWKIADGLHSWKMDGINALIKLIGG